MMHRPLLFARRIINGVIPNTLKALTLTSTRAPRHFGIKHGLVGLGSVTLVLLYQHSNQSEAAESNAQLEAFREFRQGEGETNEKYFELNLRSAKKGYADSQFSIGYQYEHGLGCEKDLRKAFEWYYKSALQGYVFAQVQLGHLYYDIKDFSKAKIWFEKSANQGLALAQYNLGRLYENGDGCKQDHKKAFELYQMAADQGHAPAQWALGYVYFRGIGCVKDNKKAMEWLLMSAKQGFIVAQYVLGVMYKDGSAGMVDKDKALEWFLQAAQQGEQQSQMQAAEIYIDKADKKRAHEWYKKAADQENAFALMTLGWMYATGFGCEKDILKAIDLLHRSAALGQEDAKLMLQELASSSDL